MSLEASLAAARADDPDGSGDNPSFDVLLEGYGIEFERRQCRTARTSRPTRACRRRSNSWFTLFGQFFDHGLDLVGKGGSGTVFIPLAEGRSADVAGSSTNFMVLTRATTAPGVDGVFGTADDVLPLNATTSFVDQNQTYGSH